MSSRLWGKHTLVIREVVLHWRHRQLLLEAINLVQEEDDTRLDEPARIADAVKQRKRFLHPVDGLVLKQQLVILADCDKEQDRGDIFEAMNPLLSL